MTLKVACFKYLTKVLDFGCLFKPFLINAYD